MSRSARTAGATRRAPDAFAALDGRDVRWCLLRGASDPAEAEGDVDLLIAPEDMEPARAALEAAGFIEQRSWGYHPHRFFLRATEDGWIKLDIVTAFRFGPAGTVRADGLEEALTRRHRAGALWRLDPADEFWALLLHVTLDKPSIEERHRAGLRDMAAVALTSPAVDTLFGSRAEAEAIVDSVRNERWDQSASWAQSLVPAGPAATLIQARHVVARRVGWRLRPLRRRGVTVALLAPDGAGKTTVAGTLARAFPIPVRSIYMGLYRKPGRRLPVGLGLASRVGLQWSRYVRAAYHRTRGRVVLFDRYTDDAGLGTQAQGGARDRFRRRVLAGALPRPDLILVLDAPAEELLRRKGEHDLERLDRARRHYRALAEASPRAAILDATRPPEAVAREAAARIWAALAARS